jgi:hypothetical protein
LKTFQFRFSTRAIPKVIDDYVSSIKGFKVLNHGDFYTRNIFFKYKGNELVDTLFVDFQNSVIGTPLIDLFYFFATSVNVEVLLSSRNELIYIYHEALTSMLIALGYKGFMPTLNELQVEILKRSSMEMYFSLTLGPFMRIPEPRVITAVQPSLFKVEYLEELKTKGRDVLMMNQEFINGQLSRFYGLGTLDYTGDEGRLKSIKSRFAMKV